MRNKKRTLIEQGEVNVVSLMDVLTTMLFFLILMASATNFTTINSESSLIGKDSDDKKQRFDLVVSYKSSRRASIILGRFNELKLIEKRDFKRYIRRKFRSKGSIGYERKLYGKTIKQLRDKVEKELKRIKQAFPHEVKVTLAVGNNVKYQQMLHMMHQLMITGEDEFFKSTNLIGQTRLIRTLFPSVTLQELGEKSAI
ncbi:MAG: biopolymer transporter ExbD [Bacteriovoracaceae bacterium]|nr:biopolymer transporter ExbD [Bacteriovoracaceae bacterium]